MWVYAYSVRVYAYTVRVYAYTVRMYTYAVCMYAYDVRARLSTMVQQQITRIEIVQAAWSLAADGGPASITMRRIAEEGGVAAMTLYNHIDGRDDVLEAVADRFWTTVSDLADTSRPGDETSAVTFADWLLRLVEEVAALGSRVPHIAALAAGRVQGPAIDALMQDFFDRGADAASAARLQTLWHGALSLLIGHLQLVGGVGSGTIDGGGADDDVAATLASCAADDDVLTAARWLLEASTA